MLAGFLRQQARRAFSWADRHCLSLPSDWMVANGFADPAGPWRGVIMDEASARAALEAAGGLEAFASAAMTAVGARAIPAHAVRRGDVGLAQVTGPDGPTLAGGICTGARWAMRSPRGVLIGRAACAAAWSLGLEDV